MSKAYIVTVGDYSDYHIKAVFLDKKKAEKYSKIYNSTNPWSKASVETFAIFDEDVDVMIKRLFVEYYINEDILIVSNVFNYDYKNIKKDELVTQKSCTGKPLRDGAVFRFMVDEGPDRDFDKLKKIAQDRYAQYKARMEGVG